MGRNQRKTGGEYEAIAAAYLEQQGMRILCRNFRCRIGEIDLVAKDGRYFVFVEVKYRKHRGSGFSLEAVHSKKQQKIETVALYYLMPNCHTVDVPCRFDVVGIDGEQIVWIPDAYQTSR